MKKGLLWLGFTSFTIAGCASNGGNVPKETWTNLSQTPPSFNVPQGLAGVIFYRTPDSVINDNTVNIYINQEYLASLQPGSFKEAAICPNHQMLHAEFSGQDPAYIRKHNTGSPYDLAVNETVYFEVVSDATYGVTLRPVDAMTGQQAVAGLSQQNHTLSRVGQIKDCGASMLKQYTLEASALFQFNKSDYANMLPQGKSEIQAVAQDMQQYMTQIDRIEVIGHTDPDGSDSYNMNLSQKRAKTVKQALEANGVNGSLISTQGRGETQLIVSDCATRYSNDSTARQACNQPNRRVEINLYGQQ